MVEEAASIEMAQEEKRRHSLPELLLCRWPPWSMCFITHKEKQYQQTNGVK